MPRRPSTSGVNLFCNARLWASRWIQPPVRLSPSLWLRVKSFFKYRRADQKTRVVEEGTASRGQASEALDR